MAVRRRGIWSNTGAVLLLYRLFCLVTTLAWQTLSHDVPATICFDERTYLMIISWVMALLLPIRFVHGSMCIGHNAIGCGMLACSGCLTLLKSWLAWCFAVSEEA